MATPGKKSGIARRLGIALGLFVGVLALAYYFIPDVTVRSALLQRYATLPELASTDRVTIVSPHLDDETLGLGGFMAKVHETGAQVCVIFMTNGDDNPIGADLQFKTGYPTPEQLIDSGIERQKEAIGALAKLGVPRENIFFLGLPDRGLAKIQNNDYASKPFKSSGTLLDHAEYSNAFIKDMPYTGDATREALIKAINQTHPTYLLTTLPEDRHSDHSATARFIKQIQPKLADSPKLFYFLIHYSHFPRPHGINESLPLVPPMGLEKRDWQIVFLSSDEIAAKRTAIMEYKSQIAIPQLGGLMKALIRRNELVLPAQ